MHLRYEVRVLRWFSGSGPEQLVLVQGAEATFEPREPGTLLVFSACASADGSGWEPDVGYFFYADPACRADAEKLGETAAKRVAPAAKRKPKACKPKK